MDASPLFRLERCNRAALHHCVGDPGNSSRRPHGRAHPGNRSDHRCSVRGFDKLRRALQFYALARAEAGRMTQAEDRRPISQRARWWAKGLSAQLIKSSITPNQISILGMVFAGLGGLSFFYSGLSVGVARAALL